MQPIIVTATMGAADFAWADALRKKHFPPERNFLSAHITLFHHLPADCANELSALLEQVTNVPAPPATLSGLLDLGGGTAYRIESPGLVAIRAEVAAAFRERLTAQDAKPGRLHITVQNKVSRATAQALYAELATKFVPRPFVLHGLAAWRYQGGPWEPIREFPFRGPPMGDE